MRQRRTCKLTEWQIRRKLERFKLHQLEGQLDGDFWQAAPGNPSVAGQQLTALATLLRAGVRQSRRVMNGIQCQYPFDRFVSMLLASAQKRDERNVSYRDDYSVKLLRVKP